MFAVMWSNGEQTKEMVLCYSRESAERQKSDIDREIARQGAYDGYDVSQVRVWIEESDAG